MTSFVWVSWTKLCLQNFFIEKVETFLLLTLLIGDMRMISFRENTYSDVYIPVTMPYSLFDALGISQVSVLLGNILRGQGVGIHIVTV